MADGVTSQVQHITSLDFDMTKALQQLQELQERFNAVMQEIASRNWTISAVLQVIEKVEDAADMEAATNALEREILRKISTKL